MAIKHEEPIRKFLYDEGPSTCEQIAEHIGLSPSRTYDVLNLMRTADLVTYRRHGQPSSVYWLLSEDA